MSNNRSLRAFVKYDSTGKIVPSSLILAQSMPKVGRWQEINAYPTQSPTTTIAPGPSTEVTIGSQIWTTANLDVTTYRNGDPIPEGPAGSWFGLTTGAWCYYNNDPALGAIYGKLYNWYAVNDPRGLAPEGFHIPTPTEWNTLGTFLGGNSVAGSKLKSNTLWNGTNESGFSALPGGYRDANGGYFFIGNYNFFWTSLEFDGINAVYSELSSGTSALSFNNTAKNTGFSVRCIKD